ncbi:MAG: hypothetical protein JWM25_2030, partial [Thermoleophilia bacterium]|nr:hypothetical protein [Thermoleophilia bacterium]
MCAWVAALALSIVATTLLAPSAAIATPAPYSGTEQGYRHIATGDRFTLVLRSDGTVWGAGRNNLGQLGDGTASDRTTPVQVTTAPATPLTDIVAIAAGMDHGIALRADGTVWAWGQNNEGQLGDGSITPRSRAVQSTYTGGAPLTDMLQVAGGDDQSYVLRADGTIWAFGNNGAGQLGDNSGLRQTRAVQSRYADNSFLTNIIQVAASGANATVLRSDGTVWSWGIGLGGRNGDNTANQRNRAVQSLYSGGAPLTDIVSVARGDMTGMVIRADGTVWTWGSNPRAQLADNTIVDRTGAIQMTKVGGTAITDAIQVAGGYLHSMVLCADGTVWAAGFNDEGNLGDGTSGTDRMRLVQMTKSGGTTLDRVVAITGGAYHSAMLRADGTVWTAGMNEYGSLGTGAALPAAKETRAVLSLFPRGTGYVQVSKGVGHAVALRADGTAWAWGTNADGELGDGTTTSRGKPVQVTTGVATPLTDIVQVAAGGEHAVAVRADGTVWAWGDNAAGQLGDGTTTDRVRAVQVTRTGAIAVIGATKVTAGALHTTIVLVDGSVLATGANPDGQLGDGTTTAALRAVVSTFVGGAAMSGIKQVDAGASGAQVAVAAGGTAWAWGDNAGGQLCDNSTTDRLRSVQVTTTAGATLTTIREAAVSSGTTSSMLLANGTIFGCGENASGQLADGTTTSPQMRAVQATRSGPSNITLARSLGGGDAHGLASLADGSVLAWGANGSGQLGDGSGAQQTRAVQATYVSTVNLSRMVQVSGGDASSVALRVDGTLWSWGGNAAYQLGDCSNADRPRAVQSDVACAMPNQPTA